jgi:hypothetical protein
MGDIVMVDEGDFRPGFHGERIWDESEIVDAHLRG